MTNDLIIPEWMVVDSLRYAMGRTSYHTTIVSEWITRNWDHLQVRTQHLIEHDLESAFQAGERYGDMSHLGHKCDVEEWRKVRELWWNK